MGRRWHLAVLSLIGFVTSFGAHVVAVNLPVYAREVGVGLAVIGLLIAVYDFAEVLAKPVFGYVADKRGKKVTLLLGLGVFSVASASFLLVDPRLLILVRLLQGLGAAAFSVISLSLVAEYFAEGRGRAYGVYNAAKGTGYVVSPAVGGAIVWATDFRAIFAVSFAIGLAALLLALTLPEPARAAGWEDDDDLSVREFLLAFANQTLLPWYGIIVVNMFLASILFGFLPVYASSLGYDQLLVGALTALATLSYLVVQPLAGLAADRAAPARTVMLGLLVASLGIVALPFATGWTLTAVVVAAGLGVGTVWTNTDTLVSRLVARSALAAGIGAAGSFKEIGDMVGPLAVGVLAQAVGLRAGFVLCGALSLAGLLAVGRRAWSARAALAD